jgi:hypothetical protein
VLRWLRRLWRDRTYEAYALCSVCGWVGNRDERHSCQGMRPLSAVTMQTFGSMVDGGARLVDPLSREDKGPKSSGDKDV